MARGSSGAALACALMLMAGSAAAQGEVAPDTTEDDEARAIFDAGAQLYNDGDFGRALASFERAYELSQRPRLLYNIAQCHDRLRDDREALAAFESYLAQVPDAENRANVEGRVAILRQRIAAQDAAALESRAAQEPSVVEQWWFWTILGVLVVGATVGVVAAVAYDRGVNEPIPGDGGRVVTALRW